MVDASKDEIVDVLDALDLGAATELKLGDPERRPCVEQFERHLRVTAVAVSETERDPARERIVIDCFLGSNWILTIHGADIAALDDFRGVAEGKGEVGLLDAPSFLTRLSEWVITSYLRAFDEIEETLDEIDVEAIAHASKDLEEQLEVLGEARRRVGRLRRTLAPHREVFATLSHSEFDSLSSEASAERFLALTARVDAALASARDVRDGIASSFDVLIVGTEHRTSEICESPHARVDPSAPRRSPRRHGGNERQHQRTHLRPLAIVFGRRHCHHPDRNCNARLRPGKTVDLNLTDAYVLRFTWQGSRHVQGATLGWASVILT